MPVTLRNTSNRKIVEFVGGTAVEVPPLGTVVTTEKKAAILAKKNPALSMGGAVMDGPAYTEQDVEAAQALRLTELRLLVSDLMRGVRKPVESYRTAAKEA